jgi:hypothetical protein
MANILLFGITKFLDFIQCQLHIERKQCFGNWTCFSFQMKMWVDTYSVVPIRKSGPKLRTTHTVSEALCSFKIRDYARSPEN